MTAPLKREIAIIGGGISGLSAAYYLEKYYFAGHPNYVLFEESKSWGGKIRTSSIEAGAGERLLLEKGPDSFQTQKPWALELINEIGLSDRLISTNDDGSYASLYSRGRLSPLPQGLALMVPTRLYPFLRSPVISWRGKARMALDLIIAPSIEDEDEAVASFVTRRMGKEVLHRLAEPLLCGIYNADANNQSLLATFPRLRELEKKYGSVIRGMLKAQAALKKAKPGSKPFLSLRGGMEELPLRLKEKLKGDCFPSSAVVSIRAQKDKKFCLITEDGRNFIVEKVVLAVPAFLAAKLLRDAAPHSARDLNRIRYVNSGVVSLAYSRSAVRTHPGSGVLIARDEKRPINAITFSSSKFSYRAPENVSLFRIFIGGSKTPDMLARSDSEIISIVASQMKEMMKIKAGPLAAQIHRWRAATPLYEVGHLKRIQEIRGNLPDGIFLTGAAYNGLGIPDCVYQAKETAQSIAALRT